MKIKWGWLALPLFCAVQMQLFAADGRLDISGQPGCRMGGMIFELDNRPTPQCHASTIAETPSGLVAAWFGGTHENNPDVGIWLSRHDGKVWTVPVEVANGVQSSSMRYPCWNPVLFKLEHGSLMLFYKVGPNPQDWWGMLMISDDDGKTWGKPWRLGEDPAIGHLLGPVKNKPIQLKDGSILCPSSTELNGWRVHFEITKDIGRTWEVVGPINDGKEFGVIQPSILTYPDGKLQVLCRSRQGVVAQSWSEDDGRTWSKVTATSLPNPNAGTDALTLSGGRQLIVYNNTTKGRSSLAIAVSSDGTKWNNVLLLENQKGEFSYPAVIQASDGLLHITYTYLRKTIKHVVVNPGKLCELAGGSHF